MTRRVSLVALLLLLVMPACSTAASNEIRCGEGSAGLLAAQAVPSATQIPCIATFPVGWSYGGFFAKSGLVRFWMNSDRAGIHAIEVELAEACDTSGAVEAVGSGEEVQRFELRASPEPHLSGATFLTFTGGCVTIRYNFAGGAPSSLLFEVERAIDLFPRKEVVAMLAQRGGILCGAGAPPCAGETGS